MPLHLLGKKSWNVYNADNIARVRRDEAAARAAEEAEEQRMQEIDAQRRLAILRGEQPPPPLDDAPRDGRPMRVGGAADAAAQEFSGGGARRKRKRQGEDDTDFELRLARGRHETSTTMTTSDLVRRQTSSAPLVDGAGHIDLFGDERSRAHAQKNEAAEAEARKRRRECEDQYTMRFANAAGKDGLGRPWYSQQDAVAAGETPSKDVWGNEDPRRRERQAKRLAADDPLAMMKRGAARVREVKQERKMLEDQRRNELRRLGGGDARHQSKTRHQERERRDRDGHRHRHRHHSPTRRSEERRSSTQKSATRRPGNADQR